VVLATAKHLGGLQVAATVDARSTHVIVGGPRRTPAVVEGMARGCWIVKPDWVMVSLEKGMQSRRPRLAGQGVLTHRIRSLGGRGAVPGDRVVPGGGRGPRGSYSRTDPLPQRPDLLSRLDRGAGGRCAPPDHAAGRPCRCLPRAGHHLPRPANPAQSPPRRPARHHHRRGARDVALRCGSQQRAWDGAGHTDPPARQTV
jgi:hypothetical protein